MDYRDAIMILLYLIALAVVITGFSDIILLALAFIIIMIISIVQKMYFDSSFENYDKKLAEHDVTRARFVDVISRKFEEISRKLDAARMEIIREISFANSKIQEVRHEGTVEMEKQYRELARKILDVENRMSEVRKNLSIAYASVDERLRSVEEKD